MSLTPMQQHMKRVRDEQEKVNQQKRLDSGDIKAADDSVDNYSAFEVTKASLETDVKALSALPKDERDKQRKDVLIPRYKGHVDAYIESNQVYANPVLVYMIIWLIDLCRIGSALELAKVAISQSQAMPGHFKSNLATFIADSVLAWAEKEHKLGNSIEPYFNQVFVSLDTWQVPDVVKMKYQKMAGLVAFDNDQFQDAISYFENAIGLETPQRKAQVTTKLDKARKIIAESLPAPGDSTQPSEPKPDTE